MPPSDTADTPRKADVLEMVRPFDPISSDAEDQYDAVVQRINHVRGRKPQLEGQYRRLENQFVGNNLTIGSGPGKGTPLSEAARRRRLRRLVEIGAALRRLEDEERFCVSALARMNDALDRWARETYGA